MLENMKEFWYLYVLLFVLIIVTVFMCNKAAAASARHQKDVNEIMEKAKRSKELRDAYKDLTNEIIQNAPAAPLFEGISLTLESKCQKTEDTKGFYSSLTDGQKKVYALYYLLSDAKESKLSAFFKSSSRPLTSDAADVAAEIFSADIYTVVKEMFDCYDEENETASVIPETVNRLDNEFAELTENIDLFALGGEYIKKNASEFLG